MNLEKQCLDASMPLRLTGRGVQHVFEQPLQIADGPVRRDAQLLVGLIEAIHPDVAGESRDAFQIFREALTSRRSSGEGNISAGEGLTVGGGPRVTSVVLRSTLRRWSPLPLRIIVGYGFIAHGYAKIANGPEHFAASLHALGAPASHAMAWATIAFEVIGGFAVLAGAFVPVVSLPLAAILLVAAITVHLPYGFSSIKLRAVTSAGPQFGPPGYEVNLLYLAALATLVFGGSGPFALDQVVANKRRSR